jgi:polygalacturonase
VRDFGAKGDGSTIDRAAIQRAVDAAKPGNSVYIPAGTYRLDDSIKVLTSNITIYGDGPATVIHHRNRRGFDLGIFSEPLSGLVVRQLSFLGQPGIYGASNDAPAIQVVGPQGTRISDCSFRGSGTAVNSTGGTYGTVIENCRVNGWGLVAIYCQGGEQINNCQLIQDDPNPDGAGSSHGLYIHSGTRNVSVQGTLIQNARKFAAQLYGEEGGTTISGITFSGCTIQNCKNGITMQGSSRAQGVQILGCMLDGVYGGPGIEVLAGDNITIQSNLVSNISRAGIALGFFTLKARREEAWLEEQFEGYAEYRARTRRLIPWLY